MLIAKAPRLTEEEIVPLTLKEATAVLNATAGLRNGARFALALGLRQGEALGLQWADFDEEARTPTIRRAIQRHMWRHGCSGECGRKRAAECPERHSGGLAVAPTKSRAGRRAVGLPDELVTALAAHRAMQKTEKARAANLWNEGGWMFAQPTGKLIDPRRDAEDWKILLKAAGVRPARLHDARHTAATMLLVLKVPTRAVMDVMGWSQVSMAARYQHVPVEVLAGIADQVAGLLWPKPPGDDDGAVGVPANV